MTRTGETGQKSTVGTDAVRAYLDLVDGFAVLEQAKGMLIAAYGVDAEQALEGLGEWASDYGVTVQHVAATLVGMVSDRRYGGPGDAGLRRDLSEVLGHRGAPPPRP